MGTYHQLTEYQRYQIYALKKAGQNQQCIAETLRVSPSATPGQRIRSQIAASTHVSPSSRRGVESRFRRDAGSVRGCPVIHIWRSGDTFSASNGFSSGDVRPIRPS